MRKLGPIRSRVGGEVTIQYGGRWRKTKQRIVTTKSFAQVVGGLESKDGANKDILHKERRWRRVGDTNVNNKLGGVSKN